MAKLFPSIVKRARKADIRFIIVLLLVVLFIMDWRALYHINSGNGYDYIGEYTILVISIFCYILLIFKIFRGKFFK